ncbi:MAG: hypothetical protein ACUBOA_03735 [Candidatus Loosdrechtia sp.]|uniref:hypothetical protein n=1 Tax=Candidatus Loosdrechtia sp. TaxID=3101272 RepID=UPI003A772750|nr:MAG: hypothetical protein QY305_09815 [Candidatus Jettenia sp. AMX2]
MIKKNKIYFYCSILFIINCLLSFSAFSQNYIINGIPERDYTKTEIRDSIVRKESLVLKDNRVYIQILLDRGAKNITDHTRYKEMFYSLPEQIFYDEATNRILYDTGTEEIEVGKVKSFLGLMPSIVLSEGVIIVSSPNDAKLLISSFNNNGTFPLSIIHSEESMEITLSRKCGQCHILDYLFSHKKWTEEDIIHVFNRLQMEKGEQFTADEQAIIDLFKQYQRGEIDKEKLSEFKTLKEMEKKDVNTFTEDIYTNTCVPCHNPSAISDIPSLYTKRRCKSIAGWIKEKEPLLFLQKDLDSLAGYLWEIKLRPHNHSICFREKGGDIQ